MSASSAFKARLRRAVTPAARAMRRAVLPRVLPRVAHRWPSEPERFRVVGLLSSSSGLGKSARLCTDVLARAGYAVSGVDVSDLYASSDGLAVPPGVGGPGRPNVSIYHLNPPMLLPGILRAGPIGYLRTFNIGYWAWELEHLPREWIETLRFVDAVMVPSTFCRLAVSRHTDKPVLVVPHPIALDNVVHSTARGDKFRVVTVFNFGSSFERKNPLAAVRAFRAAFGANEAAELILKVSDGAKYPSDRARLLAEIGDAENVSLIDAVWEEAELARFVASADAYLSLHRSEGFGLTLAEAIAAGVPVVATAWSGNTDFCLPDLHFPVDCDLVPVRDAHLAFAGTDGAEWAEPSTTHAAIQLRRLANDRNGSRSAALRLREHLREYLRTRTYEAALAELRAGRQAARETETGRVVGVEP